MNHLIYAYICYYMINCCESISKFCEENFVDSVLYDGQQYYVTRGESIAAYNEQNNSMGEFNSIRNKNDNNALTYLTDSNTTYFQSMFNLTIQFSLDTTKCNESQYTYICEVLSHNNNSVFQFLYENVEGKQQLVTHFNSTSRLSKTYNSCGDLEKPENFVYPKYYSNCRNQTYKPSTYWPNKHLLLIWFNSDAKIFKTYDTILAVRNVSITEFNHGWHQIPIHSFETARVTAMFWWKNTESVFIVREEKLGNNERRSGYVYNLFINDPNDILINETYQTITEFFGCPKINKTVTSFTSSTATPNTSNFIIILLIVLMIIVLLSIATIIALCYILKEKKGKTTRSLNDDTDSFADTTETTIQTIDSDTGIRINK